MHFSMTTCVASDDPTALVKMTHLDQMERMTHLDQVVGMMRDIEWCGADDLFVT